MFTKLLAKSDSTGKKPILQDVSDDGFEAVTMLNPNRNAFGILVGLSSVLALHVRLVGL